MAETSFIYHFNLIRRVVQDVLDLLMFYEIN